LRIEIATRALEEAYQELSKVEAICRQRIDVQIPTEWLLQNIRDSF